MAYGVENAFSDLFIYKTLSILDLPDTDIISHLHECAQFIDQAKVEVSLLTLNNYYTHVSFMAVEDITIRTGQKAVCNWDISFSQCNFLSVDFTAYLILDSQSNSARLLSSPTAA